MIKAVINVPALRPQVFSALTDYANYAKWVPGVEKCMVTSSSGSAAETEIIINSMRRIELGVRFEAQPTQSISFRMTKGKDLKSYSGTYRLMDSTDGTGTVVIAELEIEVGMMVPKFMVDKMTRKTMDDTGVALRNYIASAPPITAAAAAPARVAPAPARRRRARRILTITKTASGYNVWMLGESFSVKSLAGQ